MAAALLRNPHLLVLVVLVLLVGGGVALTTMPRLEDPRLTNRNPLVLTFLPGADPEQVEAQVTEPLERALREVDEVKLIESTSSLGVSSIAIELADRVRDTAPVLADLRSALDRVERELPPGATRPWLDDQRGAAAYGVVVALRWRSDAPPELGVLSRYADELADRLRNLPGTELVRVHGDVDEQVLVEIDPDELAARGIGADRLVAALAAADTRLPAGSLRGGAQDLVVSVDGAFDTLTRVREVPLAADGGRVAVVGDVATVRRGQQEPPLAIATVDGERCVLVGARMLTDRIADEWSAAVRAAVADLGREVEGNARLDVVFDQGRYTNVRLAGLAQNLVLGALLIWLVVALIMGWRAGTLVAATLPLAAAGILLVLQVLGVPLHQISVFGLLVAMGLLIDNAIVVTDDVTDLRRHGHAPVDAVARATRHLAVPLFASTLTTALSFAPILLLEGNVGEFVGTIATAVIVSIAVSLLLALSVVAALAGLLPLPATATEAPAAAPSTGSAPPRGWLARALAHATPARLLFLTLAPPVLGFALVPTLRQQFFPAADRDQFQVEVWANGNTSVARTQELVARLDAALRAEPDVDGTLWVAGQSMPSVYYNQIMQLDDAPFYAQGVVVARDAQAAKRLVHRAEAELPAIAPEAQIVVRPFAQGPPVDAPVILRLVGRDLQQLVAVGDEVRAAMVEVPGMLHTRATIPSPLPQAELRFDEAALRAVGLAAGDAAAQVRVQLDGAAGGELIEGTRRVPVVVRGPAAGRRDGAALAAARLVAPGTGDSLPLAAMASLAVAPRTVSITRRNGERCNELFGFVDADTLPIEAVGDVLRRLEQRGFRPPAGMRLELGGDAEQSGEAAAQLVRYVPLLVTVIVATLVLSFRSAWLAALLALVGVLSAGYGLLALWLSGYPLGFNPLIGLAGLVGVTFNDSIVVLAAIRGDAQARAGDAAAIARVVRGCWRHVWATTLTTAVGFVPLLLFSGGDFWPPLAVVIAGGVLGATPLGLVFVPAAYRRIVRWVPALLASSTAQAASAEAVTS